MIGYSWKAVVPNEPRRAPNGEAIAFHFVRWIDAVRFVAGEIVIPGSR